MGTGPMQVTIVASTHRVLRPEMKRALETCDVVIHAGGFDNQVLHYKLDMDQPLHAARESDDGGWSGGLSQVNRFGIGGVKFIMTHERVDIPGVSKGIRVVIFSYSHTYYQQEISGGLWLNPESRGYKCFILPLSMAVMTIEGGTCEVETVWLEHGYGTSGVATSQRGKAEANKYERQQRRYRQKQAEGEGQADRTEGTIKAARYGGQPAARQETIKPVPDQEKEYLFLIAKILRLRKASGSREWVIRNLGEDFRLASTVYNTCEKRPDLDARQILELLLEQISFQREHFPVGETQWGTHIPAEDMSWDTPARQVRIKATV